jgi:hypothetical protein
MPRTPVESRPLKTRTSVVGKRIARPSAVTSITSSSPCRCARSRGSRPSGSFIAILPLRLTLVKSDSALRRTSPSEVAKKIWSWSHSSSGRSTGMIAAMETPCGIGRMLTTALPREVRPPCGSRQVLSL